MIATITDAPGAYPNVVTLLARKIVQAERARFDPPVNLSYDANVDLMAVANRLWEMADACGLAEDVQFRIQLAGPVLLAQPELAVA